MSDQSIMNASKEKYTWLDAVTSAEKFSSQLILTLDHVLHHNLRGGFFLPSSSEPVLSPNYTEHGHPDVLSIQMFFVFFFSLWWTCPKLYWILGNFYLIFSQIYIYIDIQIISDIWWPIFLQIYDQYFSACISSLSQNGYPVHVWIIWLGLIHDWIKYCL